MTKYKIVCQHCGRKRVSDNLINGWCVWCWKNHKKCKHCGKPLLKNKYRHSGLVFCNMGCAGKYVGVKQNKKREYVNVPMRFLSCRKKEKLNTQDFYVGVEVETYNNDIINYDEVMNALPKNEREYLNERVSSKSDCSISGGETDVEWVTLPAQNDEAEKVVRLLCKAIKRAGFKVNRSCGVHIHIGERPDALRTKLSHRTKQKLLLLYDIYKEALFRMLPASRWCAEWCNHKKISYAPLLVSNNLFKDVINYYSQVVGTRYNHINYRPLTTIRTVEIRSHSGTTNARKILNWIKINLCLFRAARRMKLSDIIRLNGSQQEFEQKILNSDSLREHYRRRCAAVSPNSGNHPAERDIPKAKAHPKAYLALKKEITTHREARQKLAKEALKKFYATIENV